jgi:hypothetical protein
MQRVWVCHIRWDTLQSYLWFIKEKNWFILAIRMPSHWWDITLMRAEKGTLWKKKGFCNSPCNIIFGVSEDICNSLNLYIVSAKGEVTWVIELQLIKYMMQLNVTHCNWIATLSKQFILKLLCKLHYNCTHNVMMMSSIVIHLLKYNMWHLLIFEILIFIVHYDD